MALKDRYNNNLRRGDRVRDMRGDSKQEGEVVGTGLNNSALCKWDGKAVEELVSGQNLLAVDRRFK